MLAREAGVTGIVKDADEWAGQKFDLVVDYAGFNTILDKTLVGSLGGTVKTTRSPAAWSRASTSLRHPAPGAAGTVVVTF